MRKLTTMMVAALLMVGFSTMAALAGTLDPSTLSDACSTCESEMAHIARGCEGQDYTSPFNYESFGASIYTNNYKGCGDGSYCSGDKGDQHKAILSLCTCLDEWAGGIQDTDTLNISMEIVVKKADGIIYTGDNGVYWAENLDSSGIGVEWEGKKEDHCAKDWCEPEDESFENIEMLSAWELVTHDGLEGDIWGNITSDAKALLQQGKSAYAWVDIPSMIVAQDGVDRKGWEVYVKVCLFNSRIYQCTACCCLIPIGILCCEDEISRENAIFPYFTEMNNPTWWYAMVITNYGDTGGTANITVYEQDGDIAEGEVPVAAHNMAVLSVADLMSTVALTTGGTLGDSKSYIEVTADFPVTGFAMMGKASTGESMGYLPIGSMGYLMAK
jgi:hypothetical protein